MSNIKLKFSNSFLFLTLPVTAAGFAVVFLTASSDLPTLFKILVSIAVMLAALGFAAATHFRNSTDGLEATDVYAQSNNETLMEDELAMLEETAAFFSASIKSEELFSLLELRLGSALPGCRFEFFTYLTDEHADSAGAANLKRSNRKETKNLEIAVTALSRGEIVRSGALRRQDLRSGQSCSAAVPMRRGNEVICVLAVSAETNDGLPDDTQLHAIAERVTPLVASSISFESSVTNALTDNLTKLPNERAMYLILENQVAEAVRYGSERPLALVAIDIVSFDEINSRFGHAEGDKLLEFAGSLIKKQLRSMDFLARTSDDEFLVILPTTNAESAEFVVERIRKGFEAQQYELPDGTKSRINLSFGTASFGNDGDTSAKLIRAAVERKQIAKPSSTGTVLAFPKETT